MRRRSTRKIIVICLTIAIFLLVASMQPYFLGNEAYFGIDARLVCCPFAFIALLLLVLHVYVNWPLFIDLFRKGLAGTRRRKGIFRLSTVIGIFLVGVMDIPSGWRTAIAGQSEYVLMPMWAWSWLFTMLIGIHVWQNRTPFVAYWRKRGQGLRGVTRS